MTDAELAALLESARRKNESLKVTGMLLFKKGTFLQVLEGQDNVIENLYNQIRRDLRHQDPRVLSTGQLAKRQFPNWSMGFANLSGLTEDDLPGFTSFMSDDFNVDVMSKEPQRAYKMLLRFRDSA